MNEQRYWYGVDGERRGPVSLEEIHEMVRAGSLRPTDYIWNEEHQVWTRVTDFLGAMGEGTTAPPPPQEGPGFGSAEDSDDAEFQTPHPEHDWGAEAGKRHGGAWVNENAGADYASDWKGPAEYAGFWIRVGAHIIDGFILAAIGMVWFLIASGLGMMDGFLAMENASDPADIFEIWESFPFAYYAVSMCIGWIYEAGFIASSWMSTPGKRAMGIVVVGQQGERCGFGQASLRYLVKTLFASFTFGLSYLVVAFTEKKQGVHDLIAQTYCEKT